MEKYCIPNRSITHFEIFGLIFGLLRVNGIVGQEFLIKNDSHIFLELHNERYLANQNKTWVLSQDTGFWALYFLQFSLEAPNPKTHYCEYDFLKIRESRGSGQVHEDSYCGNQIRPGDIYHSAGPRIELQFKSDDMNEMLQGFAIQAFYAETKGELTRKEEQLKRTIPTIETLKASEPNLLVKRNGPNVLVIGLASGTAITSIIFVVIFIYCLKAMLKPRQTLRLHNILIAEDERMSHSDKNNVILLNTGRRYSKDKEKPTSSKNVDKPGVVTNNLYFTSSAADYSKAKASIETRLKRIHETSEARPENLYVHSIPVKSESDGSNKTLCTC